VTTRRLVVLLVLWTAGCSWLKPAPPAAKPRPRPARAPGTPAPIPPPPATIPEPTPAPPVVSPRVPDEERVAQEVNVRLARAGHIVAEIDPARLGGDQREIFWSIQAFLGRAREALSARDLPRAQVLAEKAARLADDLAASVRRSP
jgi:hypothetical protein